MLRVNHRVGDQVDTHHEASLEDACNRVKELVVGSAVRFRRDGIESRIEVEIGKHGQRSMSLPRRLYTSVLSSGLNKMTLTAILDRALRSLQHPGVSKVTYQSQTQSNVLLIQDCKGHKFKVTIERVG